MKSQSQYSAYRHSVQSAKRTLHTIQLPGFFWNSANFLGSSSHCSDWLLGNIESNGAELRLLLRLSNASPTPTDKRSAPFWRFTVCHAYASQRLQVHAMTHAQLGELSFLAAIITPSKLRFDAICKTH